MMVYVYWLKARFHVIYKKSSVRFGFTERMAGKKKKQKKIFSLDVTFNNTLKCSDGNYSQNSHVHYWFCIHFDITEAEI